MTALFKNNATSRLQSAVDAGSTSIQVLAGEGARFPAPADVDEFFMVTMEDRRTGQIEICKCTARTGDFLTILRAQEGTVAASFASQATVSHRLTAGVLDLLIGAAGVVEAPIDTKIYGRKDASWVETMTKVQIQSADSALQALIAQNSSDIDVLEADLAALEAEVATKLPASAYTAADVLAKMLTVDGAGSGLDADLLDGNDSTFFASAASVAATYVVRAGDTMSGRLTLRTPDASNPYFNLGQSAFGTPTTLTNGDMWINSSGDIGLRASGSTRTIPHLNRTNVWGAKQTTIASAAGTAGFNLPHGAAPSAPVNGDMWSTTAGWFAQVNAVTMQFASVAYVDAGLATKIGEAPIDGTQYVRKDGAWTGVVVPPGTIIADTPPPAPDAGQHWWESDTGNFFIWYVDADGGQWVQINNPGDSGAGIEDVPSDGIYYLRRNQAWAAAPQDGGEYVMVNGVWRLKEQTFPWAGSITLDIPIPTGAKRVQIQGDVFTPASTTYLIMRLSSDGTNFHTGASDYQGSGPVHWSGSAGYSAQGAVASSYAYLNTGHDNIQLPMTFTIDMNVGRVAASSDLYQFKGHVRSFYSPAANGNGTAWMGGYLNVVGVPDQLKIIRLMLANSVVARAGIVNARWMY